MVLYPTSSRHTQPARLWRAKRVSQGEGDQEVASEPQRQLGPDLFICAAKELSSRIAQGWCSSGNLPEVSSMR